MRVRVNVTYEPEKNENSSGTHLKTFSFMGLTDKTPQNETK